MPRDPRDVLLKKAREDAHLADLTVGDATVSDEQLGFFSQQAIEKAFKSELSRRGIRFRRTHDLAELIDLLRDEGATVPIALDAVVALAPFAAEMRCDYLPDDSASPFDRCAAVDLVHRTIAWVETRADDEK